MTLRLGSVFSGIGGAAEAVRQAGLGWRVVWDAEIDPAAAAVLRHRWPDVPNHGDVTRINADAVEPVDIFVGGSPCQSFSIAGKRLGLDDPHGNLALVYLALARQIRPEWLVFENVAGLLSSNGGRDFGAFLGTLGECGYRWAWRALDAQYWGVPQRRRRVFVVGRLGDWRGPAAVLVEPESLAGNPPPRQKARQDVAGAIGAGSPRSGGRGLDAREAAAGQLIAGTLKASNSKTQQNPESGLLLATGYRTSPNCGAWETGDRTGALTHGTDRTQHLVAAPRAFGGNNTAGPIDVATACTAHGGPHGRLDFESETFVTGGYGVRRLTPTECLRLQGYPDDYLDGVLWRGKPLSDGAKYRLIGNSWAVPVVAWIFRRLAAVHAVRLMDGAAP